MAKKNTGKKTTAKVEEVIAVIEPTPIEETMAAEAIEAAAIEAEEKKEKKVRSNKDNRSNGTFELVRRNDNRIRLTSNGKTIATIQMGVKKCSIHTATKDVFEALEEELQKTVTEYKMGPNSYKLPVETEKVDEVARALFGTCEELIVTPKEEKTEG